MTVKIGGMIEGAEIEIEKRHIVVRFSFPWRTLSSAIVGGGFLNADYILNLHVEKGYRSDSPQADIENAVQRLGLEGAVVGMMTAAEMKNAVQTHTYRADAGVGVKVIATGGVSNAAAAGEKIVINGAGTNGAGTINIVVLTDAKLENQAFVDLVKTATEAKALALHDLDIRCGMSAVAATGTSTDTIVVASSGAGREVEYAGTATDIGQLTGMAVRAAVREAIGSQDEIFPNRPIVRRLEERGILVGDITAAWQELFVPHPGIEDREKAGEIFKTILENAFGDINVCSLVLAGMRLEEDGKADLIPGIKDEFKLDAVNILADEIIGMAIAEYIGGTRARFEYVRYDRAKPGILGTLGPFMDDTICGIIAGVSSKLYSDYIKSRSRTITDS